MEETNIKQSNSEKRKLLKKIVDFKCMELPSIILVFLLMIYIVLVNLGFRSYDFNKILILVLTIFLSISAAIIHLIRFKASQEYLERYHQREIKNRFWIVFVIMAVLIFGGSIITKGLSMFTDLEFFAAEFAVSVLSGIAFNKISENL